MVWNEKMAFLPTSDYLFQHHHHHHVNEDRHHPSPPTQILTSSVPPQDFQGINPSLSMINQHRSSPIMSLSGYDEHDHNYYSYGNEDMMGGMDGLGHHGHGHHPVGDDDMSDDGSQVLGEKKKRLNIEQVKTLEKNFELGNKLEPERKTQLAKALGLQPRQVAIWFQNRRARWKTKQLEKDFNQLRRRFESLQADNDSLQSQNKKLHAELQALKNNETPELLGTINLNAESKGYWSNNGSDISSDINLGISTTTTTPPTDSPLSSTNLGFASSFMPTSLTAGLLHAPSKQEHGGHHNYDQTTVQEDGFCNIFGPTGAGVAVSQELKTPAFWPWPEQQNLP